MSEQALAVPSAPAPPRDIAANLKAYAFERSLGMPPAEACRRAGGKVENGLATKWEQNRRVQAWIGYYRSLGHTDEMLAAKRARLEDRLNLAAYGDILEFAELIDEMGWDSQAGPMVLIKDGEKPAGGWVPTGRKTIAVDWAKVMAASERIIISGFKFDKDSGRLTDFDRDSADRAIAQLRDMHGFKAPSRVENTGKDGGPIEYTTDADRVRALMALLARQQAA